MHPVLRFVKDDGAVAFKDLVGDFHAVNAELFVDLLADGGVQVVESQGGAGKGSVRLKDIFSVPLLATLVALVIFLLQPPVPPVVKELASTMSAATMPLSMIVIGSSLGSVSLLDAFRKGKLYLMCAIRLLLCPLLVWLLAGLMTDDLMLRVTATIIAAAPSGVIVSVLAIQYDRDAVFTSEGVLLSTVFSMLTIPLIVSIIL